MKVCVYSSKKYDIKFLDAHVNQLHEFVYISERLGENTAFYARGCEAVCIFVHDQAHEAVLKELASHGVKFLVLRCAGFNQVDLVAAKKFGIKVARVPAYSPYAIAEHAVGLILTLNRKFHRAYWRLHERNFSLDGLLGFDLHGTTVGIIGTGKIGLCFASIMKGFGCRLLAHDPYPSKELETLSVELVSLDQLLQESKIISLHCPLTPETRHLICADTIAKMSSGTMIINTGRGELIDTEAAIEGVKSGKIGALGLDVYEEEEGVFYENLSDRPLTDDTLARLLMLPNVVVTSHQGFFTQNALSAIASTTIQNLTDFEKTGSSPHEIGN